MKILFLGDVIGLSGCNAIKQHLPHQIKNICVIIHNLNISKYNVQPGENFVSNF